MTKLRIKLLDNHELTVEEIFSDSDEEVSYCITQDAKGNLIKEIDIQQELNTAHIEEFVTVVAFPEDMTSKVMLEIPECYSMMNGFLDKYNPNYFYGPKTTLFYDAIKQTPGIGIDYRFSSSSFSDNYGNPNPSFLLFDDLVINIKNIRNSAEFKDKYRKWKENFKKSYDSTRNYVDDLFEKYSKLLVVRLDLGFKQQGVLGKEEVSIEKTKKLLLKFLNAKRSNNIFSDVVGYVWKLEYGELKGYHYHLLIFMNGSNTQRDIYRGLMMGQYWISLTQGDGVFYVSNFKKRYFAKNGLLGIGMVSHFEQDKRKNLNTILRYFFKPDQYLKEKPAKGTRTCGKGESMSLSRTRAGRPRKKRNGDS
ncbi:YagK/YfjJ domain-containing protein [Rugamonas rivuli]|uniref:Inovirus Gp2 family protein n=1 Tax=Rugamonas rivuli TaxID=2743358 RepID=A0A843SL87_9BURK|nr:inovirus-type Gp2 protein [Rugamonas rivuli]MQA21527.1 inovirus Gp2 family protein [Rugamonas rivuli]